MLKTIKPLFLALAVFLAPAALASEVAFEIEPSGPQTSPARRAQQNPARGQAKARTRARAQDKSKTQPQPQAKSKTTRPATTRAPAEDPELLQRRRAMIERRIALLKKVMESGRVPEIRKSWGRRPATRKPSPELELKRLAEQGFGTKFGSRGTGAGKGKGKSKGKGGAARGPKKKPGGAKGKSGGHKGKRKGRGR